MTKNQSELIIRLAQVRNYVRPYTLPAILAAFLSISAWLSVAVEKGTKMAANWHPAGRAVRSEPFPRIRRRCSERPEAVKGAPLLGAAKRTLDGEDRSEMIAEEGKAGRNPSERWAAILVSSPAASNAWSQTQLATVSGAITDPSGAVVSGVVVTIVSQGTGLKRSAPTDTAGEYRFAGLPTGTYSLRMEKPGFQSQVRDRLELTSAAEVVINSQLAIGRPFPGNDGQRQRRRHR